MLFKFILLDDFPVLLCTLAVEVQSIAWTEKFLKAGTTYNNANVRQAMYAKCS